jgi:UDP-glucuronate 4-epimerase
MNSLITGVGGFIGFHVAKSLLIKKKSIYGIDNLNDYYDTELKKNRIRLLKKIAKKNKVNFFFYKKDLNDIVFLKNLFKKKSFTKVIHLAAQAGVRYSINNPEPYVRSNLLAFVNILEMCKHFKIKHLIFASSSSVYGLTKEIPFSEKNNVSHPLNLYAASKRSNEVIAHSYSYLYNIRITGLRFFTVYGPWGRPDMAYFLFVKSIMKNKKIYINNFGKHKRDFSYIDYVVDGVIEIYNSKNIKKKINLSKLTPADSVAPFEIFNLASGRPIKLMDFINTIENILGRKSKKVFLKYQKGDVKDTYADNKKFFKSYKARPNIDIKTGLSHFINWYKEYYKI